MSQSSYSTATDKLYGLLPTVIRERDTAEGEPLRALLRLIEGQLDTIDADIGQLERDAFIEICEPWVIPYIGDLVGTTPLFDESRVRDAGTATELFLKTNGPSLTTPDLTGPSLTPTIALRARADVAKTIYYRRRKGTLAMLEELARDVTGWAAHAVAMFALLAWTQWVRNHLRPQAAGTPDLRSVERVGRIDGAFDNAMHTVDVRAITQQEGWHNIPNLVFFLWRLNAFPLAPVTARRLGTPGDFRYHFSPLGNSAPLFTRARGPSAAEPLSTELSVPQPIRPARFFADLETYASLPAPRPGFSEFYGLFDAFPGFNIAPDPSLMVYVDGTPVPVENVHCRNLSSWSQPAASDIGIDVALGRLVLGPGLLVLPETTVSVFYYYGFPAALGGGSYPRRAWLVQRALAQEVLVVDGTGAPGTFATIGAALNQWVADGRQKALIRIQDNRTYEETLSIDVEPAGGPSPFLAIEAADGFRPHLRLDRPLVITGNQPNFTLTLGGLLVEGSIDLRGSLRGLRLIHTTLVPGVSIAEPDPVLPPPPPPAVQPSVRVAASDAGGALSNTELTVALTFSITGPLRVPDHIQKLYALDSIVDGAGIAAIAGPGPADAPGPALHLERTTLRGSTHVKQIDLATEVIFDGRVTAERVQVGCVRFSYVKPGSQVPRRYRCQPDLAEQEALDAAAAGGPLTSADMDRIRGEVRRRVRPTYTDERYGQPAYLQLALTGPIEIATGAEDGSEMGAYCHLKQPQREVNLRQRLREYVPFGLDYGLIYET
jgi:hypothetical protein